MFIVGIAQRPKFSSFSLAIIKNKHFSSPEIQRKLKNDFCRMINVIDPFKEERAKNNPIAFELYKEWKPKVLSTVKPFNLALQLSIAGHIMDYGTNNRFDVDETMKKVLKLRLPLTIQNISRTRLKKQNEFCASETIPEK